MLFSLSSFFSEKNVTKFKNFGETKLVEGAVVHYTRMAAALIKGVNPEWISVF